MAGTPSTRPRTRSANQTAVQVLLRNISVGIDVAQSGKDIPLREVLLFGQIWVFARVVMDLGDIKYKRTGAALVD